MRVYDEVEEEVSIDFAAKYKTVLIAAMAKSGGTSSDSSYVSETTNCDPFKGDGVRVYDDVKEEASIVFAAKYKTGLIAAMAKPGSTPSDSSSVSELPIVTHSICSLAK